ncbi:MAG: glycosyltransferase family 4 protein [Mariprofundaceae bacterium]|nr:glycosyltransferase family 4 protein [Mariprofundaceae bacterium]
MGAVADESLDGATGVAILRLKNLRILVVSDVSAQTVFGGAERMLHHHIRALHDAGAKVSVLTRQPTNNADILIKLDHGIDEHRLHFSGNKGRKGLLQLRKEANIWWQMHQEFDVVIAEQPFVMWALMQAGCKLPRLQVCHSFAFEEYATRHGLDWSFYHRLVVSGMRKLEASVYQSAQSHLVLSDFMQQRLQDFFNIPASQISIAAGGIDGFDLPWDKREKIRQSIWGEDAALPTIITLRNLVPRTGVDLLVQAAAIVHIDRPDVRWHVLGSGALLEPLKQLRDTLNMHKIIKFSGFLPEKKVQQHLWSADLFMLPTRSLEGFGLVTLEANVLGLPVIATPVGANPEVVPWHPLNRIAEHATPESLAKTVLEYLDTLPNFKERQKLASETEEYFSWQKHDHALTAAVNALT